MQSLKTISAGLAIFSLAGFYACSSSEIGDSKDVAQNKIYQDYTISYQEGDKEVSVTCQYRFAGSMGTTLVLNAPSKIEFDGKALKVDSSKFGGAYYTFTSPVSGFYGEHRVVFTDFNGKKYENRFSFNPFKLTDVPATADPRQPLAIHYNAGTMSSSDYVELSSTGTDSSFTYSQIGDSNQVLIPASDLLRQKEKWVSVKARRHQEPALQQGTDEGGRISIRYELNPVKIKLQ